jgi:hypothetical protein
MRKGTAAVSLVDSPSPLRSTNAGDDGLFTRDLTAVKVLTRPM